MSQDVDAPEVGEREVPALLDGVAMKALITALLLVLLVVALAQWGFVSSAWGAEAPDWTVSRYRRMDAEFYRGTVHGITHVWASIYRCRTSVSSMMVRAALDTKPYRYESEDIAQAVATVLTDVYGCTLLSAPVETSR